MKHAKVLNENIDRLHIPADRLDPVKRGAMYASQLVTNPVPGVSHFNRTLRGYSWQAPGANTYASAEIGPKGGPLQQCRDTPNSAKKIYFC